MNDNTFDDLSDKTETELSHYGTPRHSGRYPWGSGDNPFQNSDDFYSRVNELKKEGMSDRQIAELMGIKSDNGSISSTKLRALYSLARAERRNDLYSKAVTLQEEGLSNPKIADKLGLPGESSVRSLLNNDSKARTDLSINLADNLKALVDDRGIIDIGVGVPRQLNVSRERMNVALEILKLDGYEVYGLNVPQVTNKGNMTKTKVLCPPGTEYKEVYNFENIKSVSDLTSYDNGDTLKKSFQYPASLDSKRIQVRYAEEGGDKRDGVIELRRGVDDISLGLSNYAQVRILVDGTHYLKGMAVYNDNMPDGVDVIFNTNKKSNVPKIETMKEIKSDPDNPFGSTIKEVGGQSTYIDKNGNEKLTVINKRSDEGDWGEWSREISAQFLSKQPMKLINRQIDISMQEKKDEFDEIMSLTNPTVKLSLLEGYADDCDASAVSLKAAGLPGAMYKVILPVTSLKDNQVYAPHLEDGTQVALVRYPHGGTFEIPIVTVNNRNKEGVSMMGKQAVDAIGINANVANIMSGADFDGDTVMVIPTNRRIKIKSEPPLKDLEGFDTVLNYGPTSKVSNDGVTTYYRGEKPYSIMADSNTQNQMGRISNLITDMTLIGAPNEELARAVKHSMVIIDANKHKLDYKQSAVDNGIAALHKRYQSQVNPETGRVHGGAATLISKSKSDKRVLDRKPGMFVSKDTGVELLLFDTDNQIYIDPKSNKFYNKNEKRTRYIDPITGVKLYRYTGEHYHKVEYKSTKTGKNKKVSAIVKDGKMFYKNDEGKYIEVTNEKVKRFDRQNMSTKMAETDNAHTLSSGTPQEEAYAEYANGLKALGNKSRLETIKIIHNPISKSAKNAYKEEVASLEGKLHIALLNAPKERQAQTIANSVIRTKRLANPNLTNEEIKKLEQQELSRARIKVGAKRQEIAITQNEWNAIQAGAIGKSRLLDIIKHANIDILKKYAMPRTTTVLTPSKIRRIHNMARSGYTTAEIARALGVSTSTVTKTLKGE